MTRLPYPSDKPLRLPKLGSWPESWHVFDAPSAYALAAAEAANRPLLVRGEPGTGKSQLARAAAVARKRVFLAVVVHARSESQELQWQFDAVGRLGEAHTLAHVPEADIRQRLDPLHFLTPGPLWWAFHWSSAETQWQHCRTPLLPAPLQPKGWQPDKGSVLLIDEIDKADTDLPNGLLETLGNGDFTVPYLPEPVRQHAKQPPPLVIITTNEDRELPAAFVRRCLVLHLQLPKQEAALIDFLCQRGAVHLRRHCSDQVRRQAAELLVRDRQAAQQQGLPPPGQAEYLDLLRAVSGMASGETAQLELLQHISPFALHKATPPLE